MARGLLVLLLPLIRPNLELRKEAGINEVLEGPKCLLEARSHRGVVVVRLGMIEEVAFQRNRPPVNLRLFPGPSQSLRIAAEGGGDKQDVSMRGNLADRKSVV